MGASMQWREPRDPANRAFGHMIEFGKRRDAGTGYMSFSDRVGPCVLVLHEFFGLQRSFKDLADSINQEGFTVLVPDLYDGVVVDTVAEARALAASLDTDRTMRRLRAAVEHLTGNWHPRIGAVGFSLGADFAWALAEEDLLEATVLYYGVPNTDGPPVRSPVLGHYAQNDEWAPLEEARAAFSALDAAGVGAELHDYPGTGHWFANRAVADAFDADGADLARRRTVDFLLHHLS
ncbi:MAG: dienelactone hydrolase family protein [Actinomycetota bacterium]